MMDTQGANCHALAWWLAPQASIIAFKWLEGKGVQWPPNFWKHQVFLIKSTGEPSLGGWEKKYKHLCGPDLPELTMLDFLLSTSDRNELRNFHSPSPLDNAGYLTFWNSLATGLSDIQHWPSSGWKGKELHGAQDYWKLKVFLIISPEELNLGGSE